VGAVILAVTILPEAVCSDYTCQAAEHGAKYSERE